MIFEHEKFMLSQEWHYVIIFIVNMVAAIFLAIVIIEYSGLGLALLFILCIILFSQVISPVIIFLIPAYDKDEALGRAVKKGCTYALILIILVTTTYLAQLPMFSNIRGTPIESFLILISCVAIFAYIIYLRVESYKKPLPEPTLPVVVDEQSSVDR
jgi:hypothetical protein